jgi:hypothetical protein
MAYDFKCRSCRTTTSAGNIIDLFTTHTNPNGRFVCPKCMRTDTFIYRISDLQEGPEEKWERWIKGVIRIDSGIPTYSPYVFLTADSEDGPITGLHFHYYKDTRTQTSGRFKHGHGPGGPPVLGIDDMFTILAHLVSDGALAKEKVRRFADSL